MNAFIEAEKRRKLERIAKVRSNHPHLFTEVDQLKFHTLPEFILWYCQRHEIDGEFLFRSIRRGEIKKHNKNISILCYALFPDISSVAIGKFLNRDHTTILYHAGIKKRKAKNERSFNATSSPEARASDCGSDAGNG